MVPQIIGIHKLAEMLDCTAASIYSHIARKNWAAIPAPIRMGKRLAWLQTTVDDCFASKLALAAKTLQYDPPVCRTKKQGRPTKTESRAKREKAIHLYNRENSEGIMFMNMLPNISPDLHVMELGAFLSTPIPVREYLLKPILSAQGLGILHSVRGIGKTYAALSIALAVASGGAVFDWRAPQSKRVLYVDGEMPAITMQERLSALVSGMAVSPHVLQNLQILTPDLQLRPMPDLSAIEGQLLLEPHLQGIDLVILDNIATLCRSGKENESQSWQTMQAWLLELRRRGMSVLLIHHAGKNGDQRGTSAREDIMDTIISLRRPRQYRMAEGARFEVHLTKARNLAGDEAEPFEAHLQSDGDMVYWAVSKLEDVKLEEFRKLQAEGYSIRDAADEMGISKSAVGRLKKKLDGAL